MSLLRKSLAALVVAGALTISGPGPTRASAATACTKTYTVKPNDSWSRISGKVKVTMKALLAANKASTNTLLLIGDVICLPKTAKARDTKSGGLQLKPPVKRYSAKKSEAIIREIWPDHLDGRAVAIAKRESKLNAAAWNWCCVGLFQINWSAHHTWLKRMGITSPQQLLDARVNAKAGLAIYKRSNGWGAWK
jgi:LysM repeat protein